MCSRTLRAQRRGAAAARAQLQAQGSYLGMARWHHLFICIINEAEAAGLLGNPTQSSSDEMARRAPAFSVARWSSARCSQPAVELQGSSSPISIIHHPLLAEQIAPGPILPHLLPGAAPGPGCW